MRDFVRAAGGEAELVETETQPLVDRRAPRVDAAPATRRRCSVYGHFDVQPPAPLELWERDPFEPDDPRRVALRPRRRRRQGTALHAAAAAAQLAAEGALPVNVRFACDGEEEIGGQSIVDWLARTSAAPTRR